MPPPAIENLLAFIQAQDLTAAQAALESSGTPVEVLRAYDALVRDLYWKHKRIDLVAGLANAGIVYGQRHAAQATDPAARDFISGAIKNLAYNLASFTWPGWDEPGVALTASLMAQGLEAARLNLQLAEDLHRPADAVRSARWLLGAQLLAAPHEGHITEALVHLTLAVPLGDAKDFALFQGHVLLAECLLNMPGAQAAWSSLLADLSARTDAAATFACDQLSVARRVFAR